MTTKADGIFASLCLVVLWILSIQVILIFCYSSQQVDYILIHCIRSSDGFSTPPAPVNAPWLW